jgi:hypothetical protein
MALSVHLVGQRDAKTVRQAPRELPLRTHSLLLGSHIEKLLYASRGSLDKEVREAVLATTPLFTENSMVTPLSKQNLF